MEEEGDPVAEVERLKDAEECALQGEPKFVSGKQICEHYGAQGEPKPYIWLIEIDKGWGDPLCRLNRHEGDAKDVARSYPEPSTITPLYAAPQPAEPTPSQSAALEALDALDRNSSWPLDGPRKALLRGFVSSQPADQSAAVAEGWLDLDHATLTKLSVAWGYTLEETHDYVEILRDTIAAAPKP